MFQVTLTSYGQSQISSRIIIDGVILLYDYIANIASLVTISSYTVTLDEEACGNLKGVVGNVRIQDLSSTQYQAKTILFYKKDGNDKKILGGYSQETPIVQKTSTSLSLFISLDFSAFTNGFLFSSIQAGYPVATDNSDGLVHIENPNIESDDSYSVYSKSQIDALIPTNYVTLDTVQTITANKTISSTAKLYFGSPHIYMYSDLNGYLYFYTGESNSSFSSIFSISPRNLSFQLQESGQQATRPLHIQGLGDGSSRIMIDTEYIYLMNDSSIDFEYSNGTYGSLKKTTHTETVSDSDITVPDVCMDLSGRSDSKYSRFIFMFDWLQVAYFDKNGLTLGNSKAITTSYLYSNEIGSTTNPTTRIYSNFFIKHGGTSSQFLKADGSVDSNTYLTSADLPTNHVTIDTDQTITGQKTVKGINFSNSAVGLDTATNESIYAFHSGNGGNLCYQVATGAHYFLTKSNTNAPIRSLFINQDSIAMTGTVYIAKSGLYTGAKLSHDFSSGKNIFILDYVSTFKPGTDNSIDLGESTTAWKDLYSYSATTRKLTFKNPNNLYICGELTNDYHYYNGNILVYDLVLDFSNNTYSPQSQFRVRNSNGDFLIIDQDEITLKNNQFVKWDAGHIISNFEDVNDNECLVISSRSLMLNGESNLASVIVQDDKTYIKDIVIGNPYEELYSSISGESFTTTLGETQQTYQYYQTKLESELLNFGDVTISEPFSSDITDSVLQDHSTILYFSETSRHTFTYPSRVKITDSNNVSRTSVIKATTAEIDDKGISTIGVFIHPQSVTTTTSGTDINTTSVLNKAKGGRVVWNESDSSLYIGTQDLLSDGINIKSNEIKFLGDAITIQYPLLDGPTITINGGSGGKIVPSISGQTSIGSRDYTFSGVYANVLLTDTLSTISGYYLASLKATSNTDKAIVPYYPDSSQQHTSLGSTTNKWYSIYALTFYGDLSGHATQAKYLSSDSSNSTANAALGATSTSQAWSKNLNPYSNNSYNLGGSSAKWNNVYANFYNGFPIIPMGVASWDSTNSYWSVTLSPAPNSITAGMIICVRFDATNTYSSPKLNVNGLGSGYIYRTNTSFAGTTVAESWPANCYILLRASSTSNTSNWVLVSTNSYPTSTASGTTNIIPSVNSTGSSTGYDLGSTSYKWRYLYAYGVNDGVSFTNRIGSNTYTTLFGLMYSLRNSGRGSFYLLYLNYTNSDTSEQKLTRGQTLTANSNLTLNSVYESRFYLSGTNDLRTINNDTTSLSSGSFYLLTPISIAASTTANTIALALRYS